MIFPVAGPAEALSADIAKRTLESELGCSIDDLFSSFDENRLPPLRLPRCISPSRRAMKSRSAILRPDIENDLPVILTCFAGSPSYWKRTGPDPSPETSSGYRAFAETW